MAKLTKEQVLGALEQLGEGWHSTTAVVETLGLDRRYNRTVYNVLFSLDGVDSKWDPETNATNYQWRIIDET